MPFSKEIHGCHCPTWKGLLVTALVCIAIVGAFVGWSWAVQSQRLRDDIVMCENRSEVRLEAHRQTIVDLLVRLENRIDSLSEQLARLPIDEERTADR